MPDIERYIFKLEIQRFNEALNVAPKPVKMAHLGSRSEELQNRIETLKKEKRMQFREKKISNQCITITCYKCRP
jgi:hypothetical protein